MVCCLVDLAAYRISQYVVLRNTLYFVIANTFHVVRLDKPWTFVLYLGCTKHTLLHEARQTSEFCLTCTSRHTVLYRKKKGQDQRLKQDVTNTFDNLDKEEPTKANVKSVILKVAKWKALAHGLGLPDHIKKVQRIKDKLQHVMITLGAQLTEPSSKAKSIAFKFNDQMLKTLILEDDKAKVINLYVGFFSAPTVEDSVPLDNQHATRLVATTFII
ncbi:hypothetical protein B0H34DRAFT_675651 [Crassisporium funariophilum]|nr:hypothetical protein B0H34DRAFT_675651 [Crassisporium funariophilum]